jgi:hypothetical protein
MSFVPTYPENSVFNPKKPHHRKAICVIAEAQKDTKIKYHHITDPTICKPRGFPVKKAIVTSIAYYKIIT